MKKNRLMRLASGLMVAVLLTTCAISGTFAKYTTNATGADNARVAKFGVVITANGVMFNDVYEKDDTSAAISTNSVVSTGGNVVAPGTKGDLTAMTISGSPEVAVNVTYNSTLTLENWAVDGAYYCPLEITVGTTVLKGTDYGSAALFSTAVQNAINAYSKDYDANTDLSGADAPTVSWAWAFEGDNVKDTALGNAATPATVELSVTTTVTQID